MLGRAAQAAPANVSQLDGSVPISWLVKSVCTDRNDLVLPVDPYGGCPPGARIRKIRSGDPLPYHNAEQIGYQHRDAFPLTDPKDGITWIAATFDYYPFNRFNLYNGTDGYDVFMVKGGWAAIANTSDGGGYGQTFYGSDCSIGGWILFPAAGFLQSGGATLPISDVYWEKSGQSYPGACPSRYSTDTQTSWEFRPRYRFGGVSGNPVKTMDTVISYHGFRADPRFLRRGHLEVFYFTKEYGITRWEVWVPTQQNPRTTTECQTPAVMVYRDVDFVVQDCHDWSNAIPAAAPRLPVWPIPNLNLLAKPHFDGDIGAVWKSESRGGGAQAKWTVRNSAARRDTRSSAAGVRYLRLECAGGSGGGCGSSSSPGGGIYQDVPVDKFVSGGDYAFGVNARTEAGHGAIAVELQQISPDGHVLAGDAAVTATLDADNGEAGRQSAGEAGSVYLSSAFVAGTVRLDLRKTTSKIRFIVAPQSPQAFDILDAWLSPWPAPQRFGALR